MTPQTRTLKKKTLCIMTVLSILASLAMTSMPVQASPLVRIFVDMPLGYIPGVPPGPLPTGLVFVDLYIDTNITDDTPQGIVQWALSVEVDPTVLEPMGAQGALAGYFLNDFLVRYGYNFMGYSANLLPPVIDKGAGTMELISEGILGIPPIPNGAGAVPGQMPYKLCTLIFNSLSETDHSPIDLYYEVGVDAYYWTAESGLDAFPVDVVEDGHYNLPPNYMFLDALETYDWISNPIGSDWHELDPVYCTPWTLESWDDNGDGKLNPSDQIDMMRPGDPEPTWFHVEWVNPTPIAGDEVADMWVTEKPPAPEFPLGSVAPIALIAAVVYIWWVTRRKKRAL